MTTLRTNTTAASRVAPGARRAMLVWITGAGLATLLALVSVLDPVLGISGALVVGLAVGFTRSTTFGICAFIACTYLEVITEYSGSTALSPIKVCGGALIVLALMDLVSRTKIGTRAPAPTWSNHPVIVAAMIGFVALGVASLSWAADAEHVKTNVERLVNELLVFLAIGTFLLRRSQFRAIAFTVLGVGVFSTLAGVLLGAQEYGRAIGTFTDPNEYAAAMVASIGLGFGAFGAARSPWTRRACIVGIGICGWGILVSQSRGGLLALAAAGIYIVLSSRGRERVRMMGTSFVLVAAAVSMLMLTPAGQQSLERITNGDSSGRSDLWRIAILEFESEPVHGVGLGNYPVVAARFVTADTEHTELINNRVPRVAHNAYLEITAELGLLGILAFSVLAGGSVLLGIRGVGMARRLGDDGAVALGRGVVAATVGVLASNVFLSNHYNELLWALLAVSVSYHEYARRQLRMAAAIETAQQIVENLPIDEVDADVSEALAMAALDDLDTLPGLVQPRR
ncbi:MAG: O-antigen ligase family protein [Thermoleophilia bacterium]|nr:O-antigen ligase family protein [Thermoleophilia bacterium]